MTILLTFVFLLTTHFVGDFVLQTHWMASNKSKDNVALVLHVVVYSAVLATGTFAAGVGLLVLGALPHAAISGLLSGFVLVNAALHFATDYFTSRWTSRLLKQWLDGSMQDSRHVHNFFVVIGLDQLIHHVTLAATMWFFIFYLGGA